MEGGIGILDGVRFDDLDASAGMETGSSGGRCKVYSCVEDLVVSDGAAHFEVCVEVVRPDRSVHVLGDSKVDQAAPEALSSLWPCGGLVHLARVETLKAPSWDGTGPMVRVPAVDHPRDLSLPTRGMQVNSTATAVGAAVVATTISWGVSGCATQTFHSLSASTLHPNHRAQCRAVRAAIVHSGLHLA